MKGEHKRWTLDNMQLQRLDGAELCIATGYK